ncbi:MAG: hypothetical protein II508_03495 [Acholeplasmatales bacterium]|jgi:hypothetical protein|nr:hypothetical protein [Acholeplasmatales bacterium]
MKKMFLYYFRRRLPAMIILMIAIAIMTIIIQSQSSYINYSQSGDYRIETAGQTNPFIYLSIVLSVIVTIIPIMEFSFKMKRRSVDLYYSLPIKRIKLYICKYFVGLAEFLILYIPQWLISFIWLATLPSVSNIYDMSYSIYFMLASIGYGILIYTFLTFFYTMGNTLIDGIIFMALASCFLPTLMNVMYSLILGANYSDRTFYMRWFFIYSPLFDISGKMHSNMIGGTYGDINILGIILNIALAILASIAFFFIHSEKNNAELVGDESDTIFGYKLFIPLYMVTSFKLISSSISALWVVIGLVGYLFYCIYRKSFRIKRNDIITLGVSIIIGLLIAIFV